MSKSSLFLLGTILFLILAIISYFSAASFTFNRKHNNHAQNFQKLVYGVGLGATTKPAWCFINFDKRIDPRCTCIEWPIPGGYCYCMDHTGTVSYMSDTIEIGVSIEKTH